MKICGVYCIKNKVNNNFYIGSSADINKRKNQHFVALKNNKHHSKYLQRSFNKHKEENFSFNILEECNIENLLIREQYFINTLNPKYNVCKIAGSSLGVKRTEDVKKNISIAQKKRFETKNAWNKGIPRTLEEIENQRNKIIGKPSKKKGIKLSKLTCINISKGLTGRNLSEEHKTKLCKKIIEYDFNGNVLKEFTSLTEAAKDVNSFVSNLQRAIKNNKSFKKRIFKYE